MVGTSLLFVLMVALSPPAGAADRLWPGSLPAPLGEQMVHTSQAELEPEDCTPASAVMAARLLDLKVARSAVVAVSDLRREGRWPDDLGMSLRRAGEVLERRGAKVEYLEKAGLARIASGVQLGGVALVCGRNASKRLHTVLVSDFDMAADLWTVHDPDRELALLVSTEDLRRFRKDGCKDGIDVMIHGPRGRGKGGRKGKAPPEALAEPGGGGGAALAVGLGAMGALLGALGLILLGAKRGWLGRRG